MPLNLLLCVSNTLFIIGLFGLCYNGYNFLRFLICLELVLVSISLNFISFSYFMGEVTGQVFSLFLLALAGSEAALGLGLFISNYFITNSIYSYDTVTLRG